MKSRILSILILIFFLLTLSTSIFSNGLKFQGSEFLIDERTSFDVFGEKSPLFTNKLNIEFDISLLEPSHYGYILRIKNNEAKKTYNFSYYVDGSFAFFKFNEEGGKNLITAKFIYDELSAHNWFKVAINFDLQKHSLSLKIDNKHFQVDDINLPLIWRPDICFGRSDYLIEVPSIAIKQLRVSDTKQNYFFPLKERRGNIAHNYKGEAFGSIANPIWLINDAYYWVNKTKFTSGSVAGCNFDDKTDNLYIFNKDSLTTYNIRTGNVSIDVFPQRCPVDIFSGNNFLDNTKNKLYVYEVCNEERLKGTNVAVLDLKTKLWTAISSASVYMQLHHHSAYFDSSNKRHYIFGGFGGFGGFGKMEYSKSLFSFNLNTNKWDSLTLSGDKINPRYFSSMGYKKSINSLYIFGGMGNESGEQIVGRRYFYDLYRINLKNNKVTQLWKIPWNKENVVPVSQMILENDSCFYTLCYPEHFSKTFLKLYQFSLKDGSSKILGDSIPIRSDKIKTKANIYYSSNLNSLFAIVQEFDNFDISSSIKVYSLSFPPISYKELVSQDALFDKNYIAIISMATVFVLLIVILILVRIKRKKKRLEDIESMYLHSKDEDNINKKVRNISRTITTANSIYLFGEFRVCDRRNKDITYMFSSKLKQAFLTILQFSTDAGISSQMLSNILWPDKSEEKVKNSRGVTINHLRKLLKELDGIELIYEKGMFKITISSELCNCDYLRCFELIDMNLVKSNTSEFIDIIGHGKFLSSVDLEEFDSFKEEVEKKLEPVLLIEAERNFNSELYKVSLVFCRALFYIDPLNDNALYYALSSLTKLKLETEAKKQYFQFINEYKKMQGNDYTISLSELLAGKGKKKSTIIN